MSGPIYRPSELAEKIRAVVFDCYGTLADIVDLHFIDLFGQICAANGLSISSKELWERWLNEGRRMGEERGRDAGNPLARPEPPFRPFRDLWTEQFARVFRSMECHGDAAGAFGRMDGLLASANAYPEVAAVLDALRDRYTLAVLSNADEDHLQICLARNHLTFQTIISSETAASYKPYPRIFQTASTLLGLAPAEMLYVGDSPLADVIGARASGLPVAWLNRAGIARPERMPEPEIELRDLRGLLPVLLPGHG